MLTPFGKVLRKLRIDKMQTLYEMAKELECSPAYLSSVENGKKELTDKFFEKIVTFISLKKESQEYSELRLSADQSKTEFKIKVSGHASSNKRELVASFAREVSSLSEIDVRNINKILREKDKTNNG